MLLLFNSYINFYFTVSVLPEGGSFNVDNVRVCKILVSFNMLQVGLRAVVSVLAMNSKLLLLYLCVFLQGSGLSSSSVVQGMVFKRQVEGDVTKKSKAKIAIYTCAIDIMQTETKVQSLIIHAYFGTVKPTYIEPTCIQFPLI